MSKLLNFLLYYRDKIGIMMSVLIHKVVAETKLSHILNYPACFFKAHLQFYSVTHISIAIDYSPLLSTCR